MENLSRSTLISLLFCMVVVLQFLPALQQGAQHVAQNEPQHPLLPKFFMDTISLLKMSHKNSWDKIKSLVHDLQMQFSPPTLDFRAGKEEGADGVKEAVGKSIYKSKETVKESAKSAAEVVGGAVHKTSRMVKPTASASDTQSDAEL